MTMSQNLGWDTPSLPESTTPTALIAALKGRLTPRGWQVIREDTSGSPWIDVIPPNTEAIGGNGYRDIVRLYAPAAGSKLEIWIAMETLEARKQQWVLAPGSNYSGSITAAKNIVTIGSSAIQLPVVNTSDAAAMAENLATLQASTDAQAQKFDYRLDAGGIFIVATAKAAGADIAVTTASSSYGYPVVYYNQSGYAANSVLNRTFRKVGELSVDYTYGFVYYLNIMARTVHIGAKTNSATTGMYAFTWVDHDQAVSATPDGCSPIELVAVDLSTTDSTDTSKRGRGTAATTHLWGVVPWPSWARAANYIPPVDPEPATWNTVGSYRTQCGIRGGANLDTYGVIEDTRTFNTYSGSTLYTPNLTASMCGLAPSDRLFTVLGTPKIAGFGLVATQQAALALNSGAQTPNNATNLSGAFVCPGLVLDDVFGFCDAATNETIHLVRHRTLSATLQTAMDASSDYAALAISDASAFPSSGAAILGGEKITWASKTGNTLSGVARAKYGTTKIAHTVGETVSLGMWMVKVNGAAVPVGLSRPIA